MPVPLHIYASAASRRDLRRRRNRRQAWVPLSVLLTATCLFALVGAALVRAAA